MHEGQRFNLQRVCVTLLLLILVSAFLTSDVFSLIYLQRSVFWKVGEKRVWVCGMEEKRAVFLK